MVKYFLSYEEMNRMNQINELSAMINQTFHWNKARIDCLVGMLIALLSTRSINLAELAIAFPSSVKMCIRDTYKPRGQFFLTPWEC